MPDLVAQCFRRLREFPGGRGLLCRVSAHAKPDRNCDPILYTFTDFDRNFYADAVNHTNGYQLADCNADQYADVHSDPDRYADLHSHGYAVTYPDASASANHWASGLRWLGRCRLVQGK